MRLCNRAIPLALLVFCWLLWATSACTPPPPCQGSGCAKACKLGETQCTGDGKSILTCELISGVPTLQLQPCREGTCRLNNGKAACASGTVTTPCDPQACKEPCRIGAFRCDAKGAAIERCTKKDGECCPSFQEVFRQCPTYGCKRNGAKGRCDLECANPPRVCQADPSAYVCEGNLLQKCDIDSQGCPALVLHKKCSQHEVCNSDKKLCESTCSPKRPNTEQRCVGNDVYWFDECGGQGALVRKCREHETCSKGLCTCKCRDQCKSGETRCSSGGVQACVRSRKCPCYEWGPAAPCPSGQRCDAGSCKPGCSNECVSGETRCDGTKQMQTCVTDAQGCYQWGAPTSCGANECKAGKCEGTTPPASNIGNACTKGGDCSGGACISGWPGGYCSQLCNTGRQCPKDAMCTRVSGSTVCLKKCQSNVDCRAGYSCKGGVCGR